MISISLRAMLLLDLIRIRWSDRKREGEVEAKEEMMMRFSYTSLYHKQNCTKMKKSNDLIDSNLDFQLDTVRLEERAPDFVTKHERGRV